MFTFSRNNLSFITASLHWYQIAVCISLANVFSKIFFRNVSSWIIMLFWLAVVIGRPFGAYLFGKYGDRHDRI